VVALGAAVLLASALAYTSFTAASQAVTPGQLLHGATQGRWYQLTGKVLPGYRQAGDQLLFRLENRTGGASVAVRYSGEVPDPFAPGREVIVTVRRQGDGFIGQRDSLITKCPSKFKSSGTA
jgi:cytochrome c-type biogenesis protein CcmE